jgi:triosephosphate isomerase
MKSILVANWKMNPATFKEARKLFDATKKAAESVRNVSVIVAPPALYLRELAFGYKGKRLSFAAQNAYFEREGSFTGEISAAQVRESKATAVIVGHAERRAMGETNDDTRKKVAAALASGLMPILCVGESTRGTDGAHLQLIRQQLREGLADVPDAKISKVLIAYEPVWAIGAAKPMDARSMHEMAIFIRKTIVEKFGDVGMKSKILYGGSVDETNASEMRSDGDVDGLLVGRASLDPEKFKALIGALSA